jgi:hypothetical protein
MALRSRVVLPLFFLACQSNPPTGTGDGASVDSSIPNDPACDPDEPHPSDEWVSPSDGSVITTSPWIPVKLVFPEEEHWTNVRTFIDCVETTDPLAVQRNIPGFLGDGSDYLAYGDIAGLANGPHTILARLEDAIGTVAWQASRFTIERPPHHVRVNVRDVDGAAVDARVVVLLNGEPYPLESPDAHAVDPDLVDDEIHTFLVPGGATSVWLDTGDYDLIATRGPLQTVDHQTVHIDGDREIDFVVDDAFGTHLSSADFHVHTATSGDGALNQHVRVQSLLATGLDLAVVTDHDVIRDLEEEIALVSGSSERLVSVSGVEIGLYIDPPTAAPDGGSKGRPPAGIGHMNAFPLDPAVSYPDSTDNLGRFLNDLHEAQVAHNPQKDGILELNHPRGMQQDPTAPIQTNADLFNGMGFDATDGFGDGTNAWMVVSDGGLRAIDFDALEIMNRGSWELYNQVRGDWFTFLGWGHRMTGVGNSDSHALTTEWAGYPTNLASCTRDGNDAAAREAFILCWIQSVKAGKIQVTTGPLVDLTLSDGATTADLGDVVDPTAAVTANVRVRAAAWVPVSEVRLVVDGEIVETRIVTDADRNADGSLDLRTSWPVATTGADQWVIAEAGWPLDQGYPDDPTVLGTYALVVPEYLPLGFTNPIFVDGEGDGNWAP